MRGVVAVHPDQLQAAAGMPPPGPRGRPDSFRTPEACRTNRPTPAIRWISDSPRYGAPSAPAGSPAPAAAAPTAARPAASFSRSGSVLMNRPTMLSMPATSAGRPATVTPNRTSERPLNRDSRTPHAACSSVFSVRPSRARQRAQARHRARHRAKHDLLRRRPRTARSRRHKPAARRHPGKRIPPVAHRRRTGPGPPDRQGSRGTASPPQAASPRVQRNSSRTAPAPTSRPSKDDGCSAAADAAPPTAGSARTAAAAPRESSNRSTRSAAAIARKPIRPLDSAESRKIDLPPRHRRAPDNHLDRMAQAAPRQSTPAGWRAATPRHPPQPAAAPASKAPASSRSSCTV